MSARLEYHFGRFPFESQNEKAGAAIRRALEARPRTPGAATRVVLSQGWRASRVYVPIGFRGWSYVMVDVCIAGARSWFATIMFALSASGALAHVVARSRIITCNAFSDELSNTTSNSVYAPIHKHLGQRSIRMRV
ncbi:hypothetical protein EVAR_37140_1 [Eumeta japonica]|uniref:Uncharacterized protein n=1 Tax=Eumeta variegata TaxID=151549 RepID=A0A4C1XN86_EUMVA|nr:hypothetical protein EVAR_37140_1 [Eumeta japonica]